MHTSTSHRAIGARWAWLIAFVAIGIVAVLLWRGNGSPDATDDGTVAPSGKTAAPARPPAGSSDADDSAGAPAATTAGATTRSEIPRLVATECRADAGGVEIVCYDAHLPESRAAPRAGVVTLHVAVVQGSADAPADPVMFLHGGPAVPATAGFLPIVDRGFQQMYGDRDVIVFDQRGSGLARPRPTCEFDGTYRESLRADIDESALEWLARQTEPCLTARTSPDLDELTTAAIAADVADVVRLLGYPSVNVFGSSFGSRVALTYAARAEPGAIRSIVLEGPYPPDVDGVARRGEAGIAGLRALFGACEADPDCGAAYPDLETRLSDLVVQLTAEPVRLPGGRIVNGTRFAEVVYRTASSGEGITRIPHLIRDTEAGDLTLLAELFEDTARTFDDVDAVAYFATVCSTTSTESAADLAATVAALPDGLASYFGKLGEATLALCDAVGLTGDGRPPAPAAVPTLYLVGSVDPVTPPTWSDAAATGSWPGFVAELPFGTHTNLFSVPDCTGQIVAEFVATLDAPRLGCIAEAAPIEFEP